MYSFTKKVLVVIADIPLLRSGTAFSRINSPPAEGCRLCRRGGRNLLLSFLYYNCALPFVVMCLRGVFLL
jgi:hypothetical protein